MGCGSSGESGGDALSAQEVAARYGYDEASATLSPVYALVPQYMDPNDGYARDLLAAKCLTGVVEYRAVPPGPQASLGEERTGQPIFNVQVAAQWGYPHLHSPASAESGMGVPDGFEITPEIEAAMIECGQAADERLGTMPVGPLGSIENTGWAAVPEDAGFQVAVAAWRTCMAPAGVIDLPDDPHEMPPASVVTAGSQTEDAQGNLVGNKDSVASDREREVAVLDAQCRDQVGLDSAEMHARAQAELTAIGRDIEGFEATRVAYEEYEKKLDEVITELG